MYGTLEEDILKTAKHHIKDKVERLGYAHNGKSYWEYMRWTFKQIIYHNICKANKVQNNIYHIENHEYRQCFENLDLNKILEIQNISGRDSTKGFIWVLNTSIFFIAE